MTKEQPNGKTLTDRMYSAVMWAVELHGRDARKGTNIPYLAHLLEVCALVQQDGGDEDEGIAALLHDALEDKAELIEVGEIGKKFGARVQKLVEAASDTDPAWDGKGEKTPWPQRKLAYIKHVRSGSPRDMRVSLADKVYNLGAILRDYARIEDEVWMRFNAPKNGLYWYYHSLAKAYHHIGVESNLLSALDEQVVKFSQIPGATEPYDPN